MNWNDLRFFIAVARQRTLAAASRTLGVDATTVGRRIERLTEELGAELLEIGPSGYVLTAGGEALLRHAEEMERAALSATSTLKGERTRLAGTVRLSLSEGFATWVVARHLSSFQETHPDIALEIVSTNGFLNPSKREADMAVMLARPARGPLNIRKLTDYTLGLYAAQAYVDRHGAPATIADLKARNLIGYIPDFIYADELRYLPEIDAELVPSLGSSSINVQHAMTAAGLGIAPLPHFIGRQDETLMPLLADSVCIQRSFWLVVHEDLSRVARVRAVIDWLGRITADRADLFVAG